MWLGGRHPEVTISIAFSGFALLIAGALIPCLKRCRKMQDAVAPEEVEEAVTGIEVPVIRSEAAESSKKNLGSAAG